MKAFKTSSKKVLGWGCSREALEMENGYVCKKDSGWSNRYAGCPDDDVLSNLILEYSHLEQVQKFLELEKEGYNLSGGGYGILAEFLVSQIAMEQGFESILALCLDIRIRRNNKNNYMDIVGLYENAVTSTKGRDISERDDMTIEDMELVIDGLDFVIKDIHSGNMINNLIVDYACIREWD